MLNENLKNLRIKRGLSQEALAMQLNVVRQTVSKWEKGLSVPDASMLIKLAEVLGTSVAELLGGDAKPETDTEEISRQLEQVNAAFAVKAERSRRSGKTALAVVTTIVCGLAGILLGLESDIPIPELGSIFAIAVVGAFAIHSSGGR